MPRWSRSEVELLEPVLEAMEVALGPLAGRDVVVLCSAHGDLAVRLAARVGVGGSVLGLERSDRLVEVARAKAAAATTAATVAFDTCPVDRLPLPDGSVDVIVSDSIVDPTPLPTDIGQPEMARVLRPGGVMVVTDILGPATMSHGVRDVLAAIGVGYWCDSDENDFRSWMLEAGLVDTGVVDLTWVVRRVWQERAALQGSYLGGGFEVFLGSGPFSLGRGFRYVLASGHRPPAKIVPRPVAGARVIPT